MMSFVFFLWYQIKYINIYSGICKSDFTGNRFLHLFLVYTHGKTVGGYGISFWEWALIMTYIFFFYYL